MSASREPAEFNPRANDLGDAAPPNDRGVGRAQWAALIAALLGWMFDGLEMGLFPLVARPALLDLLNLDPALKDSDGPVAMWQGIITASFLVGAATGGVLFGWLGDRIGRVRAMTLSVLCYALFSGLGGLAGEAWHIAVLRFIAALGMGGEWSLGVALVTELWPNRSRAWLAGLIGAAANVGYLVIGVAGLFLARIIQPIESALHGSGLLSAETVNWLTGHEGWRILMLAGVLPGFLTFLIRIFVPESHKWERERDTGRTGQWSNGDLIGVLVGAGSGIGMIVLWLKTSSPVALAIGSVLALLICGIGFLQPVRGYLARTAAGGATLSMPSDVIFRRLLLAAILSGIALVGTWCSIQWAPTWAAKLAPGRPEVRSYTQIASSAGAVLGTILAALLGDLLGRRLSYLALCAASILVSIGLYQLNTEFNAMFLVWVFLTGGITASFYGWLPLYLPELFPTAVRATGQGFGFNFGRLLAAIGALQLGSLINTVFKGSYPAACSLMCLVYLLGVIVLFAPETKGKPLPD